MESIVPEYAALPQSTGYRFASPCNTIDRPPREISTDALAGPRTTPPSLPLRLLPSPSNLFDVCDPGAEGTVATNRSGLDRTPPAAVSSVEGDFGGEDENGD